MSEWLPKISPDSNILKIFFKNKTSTLETASFGIVDVQEFYQLKTDDLAKGLIKDPDSGKEYMARGKLTSEELLLVAESASQSKYLDRHVEWLQTALKQAKAEQRDDNLIRDIR